MAEPEALHGETPSNWTWKSGPVEPGPAVLVDVDGVISDGSQRQHHLKRGKRDWKAFFADAGLDDPIEGSIQLLDLFDVALTVVLLTARPDYLCEDTVDWLTRHAFRWDLLVMRGRRDGGLSSAEFKRRSVRELRDAGHVIELALDDDERNIDMFRSEGVSSLYVHSGYYQD